MELIGLAGEMGTGKDVVADFLIEHYGFQRVSVGRHIRHELSTYNYPSGAIIPKEVRALMAQGGATKRLNLLNQKPTPTDIRIALQWFGELKVQIDPWHWISKMTLEIKERRLEKVVWSDIRRPLEGQTVKQMGGSLWRIKRPFVKRKIEDIRATKHITETGFDDWEFDEVINNSRSKLELVARVAAIMEKR